MAGPGMGPALRDPGLHFFVGEKCFGCNGRGLNPGSSTRRGCCELSWPHTVGLTGLSCSWEMFRAWTLPGFECQPCPCCLGFPIYKMRITRLQLEGECAD